MDFQLLTMHIIEVMCIMDNITTTTTAMYIYISACVHMQSIYYYYYGLNKEN